MADDANEDGVGANDRLRVWKAGARAEGEYGFITENDYASYSIAFDVFSDAENHPAEPFYVIERSS